MTDSEKRSPVVEIFGPTLQGEGALAGVPTHFIRMGGCDYACSWCDSSHAVLPEEVRKAEKITVQEMLERIDRLPGAPMWLTISGGNPVLHELTDLVDKLHDRGYKVAVETQGTIFKPWLVNVDRLTVSPKPPSSGNVTTIELLARFLNQV